MALTRPFAGGGRPAGPAGRVERVRVGLFGQQFSTTLQSSVTMPGYAGAFWPTERPSQ